MRNYDRRGCSLADVLERLEAGKIGHQADMDWLGIDSYTRWSRSCTLMAAECLPIAP